MTLTLGSLTALTVALACYALLRARRVPEDPLGSCRCPHCGQKLRYRAEQAGRRMLCPRCVRVFTVPAAGAAGWDQQSAEVNPSPYPARHRGEAG